MKFWLRLLLAGFVVTISGLVYGSIAVGVPSQDLNPADAAAERLSVAISSWAMGSGAVMTLVGLVGLGCIWASRLLQSKS